MASPVPIPEPGRNQQQSTAQPTSEAIGVTSPELQLAQYYVRFASKNETAGPFPGFAIRNMIQNRYLGITNMICEVDIAIGLCFQNLESLVPLQLRRQPVPS